MVTFCNPMSCSGFSLELLGGCSMFWIAMVVLFFVIVLSRKWVAEAINMPWSNFGAFGLGYLAMIVAGVVSCNSKIALGVGIVGCYLGAYFGGAVFGDSGGGY
jgi:uncharacterized membrane protein YkgB